MANVEDEPDTACGLELGLDEKAPPCRADSAARESEAMGPGFSTLAGAGVVVFCEMLAEILHGEIV